MVVAAWLPGTEGAGVADVLTGATPFTGRLPYTWPASEEVLGQPRADACDGALYPYGYGLTVAGDLLPDAASCDAEEQA